MDLSGLQSSLVAVAHPSLLDVDPDLSLGNHASPAFPVDDGSSLESNCIEILMSIMPCLRRGYL